VRPRGTEVVDLRLQHARTREAVVRERLKMDFDWKFSLGHAADMDRDFGYFPRLAKTGDPTGPAHPKFDDRDWPTVDVPHDWAVALGYDRNAEAEHAYKKIGRQYPENSIGWYRKTFEIPDADMGRRLSIEFDGVFRDCEVWFNGHPVWQHQSGYTSFSVDITDYANYGGKNVLVVRADATGYELWAYEGAGIYRHVWLVKTQPLHVGLWGTFVTSEVVRADGKTRAEITIETTVANEQDVGVECKLVSTVVDPEGREVGSAESSQGIDPWSQEVVTQKLSIPEAQLWSLESPNLYRAITTVSQAQGTADTYDTTFGIRTIRFDPDKGFFLNDEPMKLKGACIHQDHGGVGIAVPDSLHQHRVERLKEMGANALRCAHNWVAPEALDACDRMGFLVMDEARMSGSSRELLEQLGTMIRRDRNHPCVIIWSLGNEEMAIQKNVTGERIMRTMRRVVRSLDTTRPVTLAVHGGDGGPVNDALDLLGCNYLNLGDLDELHGKEPHKPIFLSEAASTLTTRGIYERDDLNHCTGYDDNTFSPEWARSAEKMWTYVAAREFLAGTFVWSGFDYGGEPESNEWPSVHCNYGAMDRACFPKDNFHYFRAWWSDKTVLHLLPHWNWEGREGQEIRVWCHSNCDEVELLLNGESLGRKEMPRNSHLEWGVAYDPGVLEARGYSGGELVATEKVETTGTPAAIRLRPERTVLDADNQDVSAVVVEVIDDAGRVVPTAGNEITFSLTGSGRIVGVCNGDPACKITEDETTYPAFNGLLMVYVQAGRKAGPMSLEAMSEGLTGGSAAIEATACTVVCQN
jgi:beta-galactosidase